MKTIFTGLICFLQFTLIHSLRAQDEGNVFDRAVFYKAMASNKMKEVDDYLQLLPACTVAGKQAFEGALLMKKAGLITGAAKKLNLFKAGHRKLEAEIKKDSNNAEFRFLRLMIQENSPGVLGYKGQIQSDNLYIRQSYKKMPKALQDAVTEYSRKSKVLKVQDS